MVRLYAHGGSGNHGCEAIVRTTVKMLESPAVLATTAPVGRGGAPAARGAF